MAIDFPNREPAFIERTAWSDPISEKALRRPLAKDKTNDPWRKGQPWLQNVSYLIVNVTTKNNIRCAVFRHDKEQYQTVTIPIQHILLTNLNHGNIADLLKFKQICFWCQTIGNFSKRGDGAIVCKDLLHSCYMQVGISNDAGVNLPCQLSMKLEVKNAFNIDFNFVKKEGELYYMERKTSVQIVGIEDLDQKIKTLTATKPFL